jgi:hypothetical protein
LWPFTDTRASQTELAPLLRETNSLLRELILAVAGSPARTATTKTSLPHPPRKLTARDVTIHTRESRAALDLKAAQAAQTAKSSLELHPSWAPPIEADLEILQAATEPTFAVRPLMTALGNPSADAPSAPKPAPDGRNTSPKPSAT